MKNQINFKFFACITFFSLFIIIPACQRKVEGRNVIFIMVDTLRADYLGCYGNKYIVSPHIDRLAAGGLLLSNHFTVVPTTLASTTSLFTSLYPHTHGVPRNGFPVSKKNLTLAEIFRKHGYETAAFIGSYPLNSKRHIDQGFRLYNEEFDIKGGGAKLQRRAETVNKAIFEWLDDRPDRSFFLFIHYFDPHPPYQPPHPYDSIYDDYKRKWDGSLENLEEARIQLSTTDGKVNKDIKHLGALYAGEISYVDFHIGNLLKKLESKDLLRKSIIVFTADHGETLWEHQDYFNHGLMVYDTTIHIPLIIYAPGLVPAGATSNYLLRNIDIAPTILDLLHWEKPTRYEGQSFSNILFQKEGDLNRKERVVYSEASQPYMGAWKWVEEDVRWKNELKAKCIRTSKWKYIFIPYKNIEELYNIEDDPGEVNNLMNNISQDNPEFISYLRDKLAIWSLNISKERISKDFKISDDEKEKLKALGYIH